MVSATFRVPADWKGEGIEVRCLARGTRKVLWKEQATTWAERRVPLQVRVAPVSSGPTPHVVARPEIAEGAETAAGPTAQQQPSPADEKPTTWVSANRGPEQPALASPADDPTP